MSAVAVAAMGILGNHDLERRGSHDTFSPLRQSTQQKIELVMYIICG